MAERAAVAGAIWGLQPLRQKGLGMLLAGACVSRKQPVGVKTALTADAERSEAGVCKISLCFLLCYLIQGPCSREVMDLTGISLK